ncbi:sterol desaturase family protein [Herbaspirillum rhizosphaerae]|uniref:Sterol desaturase family protein n=1 Tax=Herbaspirillum rhizosphaerae TaxID=346179 RepID=A0ABW8ZDP5_9BURK
MAAYRSAIEDASALFSYAPFYLLVAAIFFKLDSGLTDSKFSIKKYFQYLLPKYVWSKSSFKVDIQWHILSFFRIPGFFLKFLITTTSLSLMPSLINHLSINNTALAKWLQAFIATSPIGEFIVFAVALLAFDFGTFFAHWLSHKSEFLWQFHKAHHFSEQLNYFAGERVHPVDGFIGFNTGIVLMAFSVSVLMPVPENILSGPSIYASKHEWFYYLFLFYPSFVNRLTHAHFPISYGRFFDRVFVTPAYHLRHHSKAVMNMNFGQFFSIWDWMFRTQLLPSSDKSIDHRQILGVDGMGDRYYRNAFEFLYLPFFDAANVVKKNIFRMLKIEK